MADERRAMAEALNASGKDSKAVARYVDRPVDGERCSACTMWRPPSSCTAVSGVISPDGHCKYFEAKP